MGPTSSDPPAPRKGFSFLLQAWHQPLAALETSAPTKGAPWIPCLGCQEIPSRHTRMSKGRAYV